VADPVLKPSRLDIDSNGGDPWKVK
jgi:hypothetical protein